MKSHSLRHIAMVVVSLGLALPFALIADEGSRSAISGLAATDRLSLASTSVINSVGTSADRTGQAAATTSSSLEISEIETLHESGTSQSASQSETAAAISAETTDEMPSDTTPPTTLATVTSSASETTTEETEKPTSTGTDETEKPTTKTTTVTTTTQPTTAATTAATQPTTAATVATTQPTTTTTEPDWRARSAELHADAFVIDTHCDTLLDIVDRTTWLPIMNISRDTSSMIDIPKMQKGGIDLQVFAAYTSGYALAGGGQDFARANSRLLSLINGLKWTLDQNSKSLQPIVSLNDVQATVSAGKIGVLSSIEGAYSLNPETGLELLRQYSDLGVRMLAPTWSNSNALGEGVNETYKDGSASSGGLTELGKSVVREMNRLGMVVDVSHMNDATFWETMEATTAPVIASHSCAYSLNNNVRNLKDDQIRAIAQAGGVIQVNFHRPFLALDPATVTIDTLVDHIDYIVDLVGIDYVGLGSDFDGAKMPEGLENASLMPGITLELMSRGYDDESIRRILGANTARLFRDVWQKASITGSDNGGPGIDTPLTMGTKLDSTTPTLTAVIQSGDGRELDLDSIKVIIDGQILTPGYDATTATASLTLTTPLTEQFHVVTFVAANLSGEITRKTRICRIDQP